MKPCEIPCDYCGAKPAFWFAGTSVAVCQRIDCQQENQQRWKEHCGGDEQAAQAEEYGNQMMN